MARRPGRPSRAAALTGRGVQPLARTCIGSTRLGSAAGWTPPAEHAQDWLAEALAAAQELGL